MPSDDTIFFPRERGDITVPDDLPFPIAHVPEVEDARNLLRDLGVRFFEWRELICEYLIKILSNPEAEQPARAGATAGLRAYHQVRLQGSEDVGPLLGGSGPSCPNGMRLHPEASTISRNLVQFTVDRIR